MSSKKKLKARIKTLEKDMDVAYDLIESLEEEALAKRTNPFKLYANSEPITWNSEHFKNAVDAVKIVSDFGSRFFVKSEPKMNDEG